MTDLVGPWFVGSNSTSGSALSNPAGDLYQLSLFDDNVTFTDSLAVGSEVFASNGFLFPGFGNDTLSIGALYRYPTASGITVWLGAGNDVLVVKGWDTSGSNDYTVSLLGDDPFLSTSRNGDDSITLSGEFTARALSVDLGGGNDTLDIQQLSFGANTTSVQVAGNGGNDQVFLSGSPSDYGLTNVTGTEYEPLGGAWSGSRNNISYTFSGVELIKFQSANPPTNTPPTATNDSVVALQNTDLTSVTVNGQTYSLAQFLLSNDTDPDGNKLSITGVSVDPSAGIAVTFNNGSVIVSPKEDFVGSASFNYTISDGTATATASVNVTVNAGPGITRPGTNGADNIGGTIWNDNLSGGNGNDIINGGRGQDSIFGGNGDDILIGGRGKDTVTGGNGADVFVLAAGDGADTFTDFKPGTDKIGLTTGGANGLKFSDLYFQGSSIYKGVGGELLATLTGVNTTTLTASNFIPFSA